MCPGRLGAKQAIFAFVALNLSKFAVCLQSDERLGLPPDSNDKWGCNRRFPRAEDLKIELATLGPRERDDVLVSLDKKCLVCLYSLALFKGLRVQANRICGPDPAKGPNRQAVRNNRSKRHTSYNGYLLMCISDSNRKIEQVEWLYSGSSGS